jgi:hypothetical protein
MLKEKQRVMRRARVMRKATLMNLAKPTQTEKQKERVLCLH